MTAALDAPHRGIGEREGAREVHRPDGDAATPAWKSTGTTAEFRGGGGDDSSRTTRSSRGVPSTTIVAECPSANVATSAERRRPVAMVGKRAPRHARDGRDARANARDDPSRLSSPTPFSSAPFSSAPLSSAGKRSTSTAPEARPSAKTLRPRRSRRSTARATMASRVADDIISRAGWKPPEEEEREATSPPASPPASPPSSSAAYRHRRARPRASPVTRYVVPFADVVHSSAVIAAPAPSSGAAISGPGRVSGAACASDPRRGVIRHVATAPDVYPTAASIAKTASPSGATTRAKARRWRSPFARRDLILASDADVVVGRVDATRLGDLHVGPLRVGRAIVPVLDANRPFDRVVARPQAALVGGRWQQPLPSSTSAARDAMPLVVAPDSTRATIGRARGAIGRARERPSQLGAA